jgi:alpha-ketoglutarate-dependent taurine dioxygenase
LVKTGALSPGGSLLVVEPAADDVDLVDWSRANGPLVERLLVRHGALLFRGFAMGEAERFESFALTLCTELFEENGEHPRRNVSGRVYTPVFYPPEQRLLWHNENSFNQRWPRKILFACVQPAAAGGATPVVDSRKVYDLIEPGIRGRFESRGVMYVRNYGGGLGLDWQTVFRTSDRDEVEAQCRREGIEYEWKSGDRLRTRCVRPAVIRHPQSGEPVWFTQAQHWHVACLDAATRAGLQSVFAEADRPRHCYYGDGTPIPDEEMEAILGVYARLEESFAWERGDVLALDNLLTAHGREPYTGERKLLVAMGEMGSF